MAIIWKEFPEINRKVAFNSNFSGNSTGLGCHCGVISGVSATFGTDCYAANAGKNIQVLDTTKEKLLAYTVKSYGCYATPPIAESIKVFKYFTDIKLTFQDIMETGISELITSCERVPLWMLSDVINYDSANRKNLSPISAGDVIYQAYGHTSDFVKYLIDSKIGYVMASPIIQNPYHRTAKNYSLNQGWFWIPPGHLNRAIDVSQVYGEDQFPTKKDWVKTVAGDLGSDMKELAPELVLKSVFNDGVFPEDKRFKRSFSREEE